MSVYQINEYPTGMWQETCLTICYECINYFMAVDTVEHCRLSALLEEWGGWHVDFPSCEDTHCKSGEQRCRHEDAPYFSSQTCEGCGCRSAGDRWDTLASRKLTPAEVIGLSA
jgi:hypothetical protein